MVTAAALTPTKGPGAANLQRAVLTAAPEPLPCSRSQRGSTAHSSRQHRSPAPADFPDFPADSPGTACPRPPAPLREEAGPRLSFSGCPEAAEPLRVPAEPAEAMLAARQPLAGSKAGSRRSAAGGRGAAETRRGKELPPVLRRQHLGQESDLAAHGPLLSSPGASGRTHLPPLPGAKSRSAPCALAGAALLRLPAPRGGSKTAGRLKQLC